MKDTDEDKACIDTSDLHNKNLRIDTVNRTARQGNGIELLHAKEYITTRLETNLQLDTIEYGVWSTTIRTKTHPSWSIPPTNRIITRQHIAKFLEEVSQLTQLLITNYTNLVLLGDSNKHTQDIENPDSLIYNNTMEALGLQQHINTPTHKLGNMLDLIYMENVNRVKVLHSFIGNFISDHRVVGIELKIRKQLQKHQLTKHRSYREFNLNSFTQEFNNYKILEQPTLKDAI